MTLQIRGRLARPAETRTTRLGEAVLRVCIEQEQRAMGGPREIVCDLVTGPGEAAHIATRHRAVHLRAGSEVAVIGTGLEPGKAGPLRVKVLRLQGCTQITPLQLPEAHHEPKGQAA